MTTDSAAAPTAHRGAARIAGGLAAAMIIAFALDAADAAIAHAAGASAQFSPLKPPVYAALTIIGILAGAAGWSRVRARADRPRRLLRTLVPAVLVVSFVPDLIVGVIGKLPGTSWGAVGALMVMHLIVGGAAVAAYLRLLPLPEDRR